MRHRAAALIAGLATAAWIASRDLSLLSIPSAYVGYQPSDPLLAQLIEPVLHAPWIGSTSWLFAALLALCLASEAWLLSIIYGASGAATAVALIATVVSEPWTMTIRHAGPLALAVAFSWLTWMFVVRDGWHDRPKSVALLCLGLTSWMAAIASSWLALIGLPMILAGLTTGEHRKRVRTGFVVAGVMASVAGLMLYCARSASLTSSLTASSAPTPSMFDVLRVLIDPTHRTLIASSSSPDIGDLVVIALGVLGVTGATTRRRWRGTVIGSVGVAVGIVMLWPLWRADVTNLILWLATPFVAVGLTIAARTIAARHQMVVTAVGGVALVLLSASNWSTSQAARDTIRGGLLAPLLASLEREDAVFVAEDLEIDAAIVASRGLRGAAWRVGQDPAQVAELDDEGRALLAGPLARRHLELSGFRFRDVTADTTPDAFTVSRIVGQLHCAIVRSDRWSLLPGLEYTGRLGVEVPGGFGGVMTLIVGDDGDRPRVRVMNLRGEEQPLTIEPLLAAPSVDAPPPDYWFDDGDPARAPGQVFRLRLPAHPTAATELDVALGRRAPRVIARLSGFDAPARGRVCASPLPARELWAEEDAARESMLSLSAPAMLTAGWYGVEGQGSGTVHRWTDRVAVVLIPIARRVPVRVAIDAEPAALDGDRPTLGVAVNGIEQPTHVMRDERGRYEWTVPASTWLTGTNELVFAVSRVLRPTDVGGQDPRVLGMKVTRLALTWLGE